MSARSRSAHSVWRSNLRLATQSPAGLALRFRASLGERPGQLRSPDKLHGVSSQLLTRIEEGAQRIPRRPTAAYRRCFVITRIRCERTAHRILRYVSYGELRRVAAGDQRRDRDKVLTVGLHGVRRRFPRLPVIQELREPLRKQIGIRYFGFRITPDRPGFWRADAAMRQQLLCCEPCVVLY